MNKPFYITTTLPYVNGKPHIGHIMEFIQADVIARSHRLAGDEVVFNVGTDEHGQKIYQKALELGQTPQEYCDEMSEHFNIISGLNSVLLSMWKDLEPECALSSEIFVESIPSFHVLKSYPVSGFS